MEFQKDRVGCLCQGVWLGQAWWSRDRKSKSWGRVQDEHGKEENAREYQIYRRTLSRRCFRERSCFTAFTKCFTLRAKITASHLNWSTLVCANCLPWLESNSTHPKYKSMVDVYFKRLKDLKNTMKKLEARRYDWWSVRAASSTLETWRDEKALATIAQVRQQLPRKNSTSEVRIQIRARNTKSHHRSSRSGGSERCDGSFNITVFSSMKDTRGRHQSSSRSQKDAVRQQSQSRRNNNSRLSTSSGSRLIFNLNEVW